MRTYTGPSVLVVELVVELGYLPMDAASGNWISRPALFRLSANLPSG